VNKLTPKILTLEPEAPPAPTEIELLTEIRDALKK
jgi:large-conductance mechanosensitive channel